MNPDIIIPVSFFAGIFGIAYMFFSTRNRERMALIEKGQSAELFSKSNDSVSWTLKLGTMAIGVGLGILVANMMVKAQIMDDEIAFPAMIFLFAGIGLVISYYLAKKEVK